MNDMLIECTDNLSGMSKAIAAVYPKTEHQLCIAHAIRSNLQYVSYKHRKVLVADLKPIYTAVTEQEALMALEAFATKWNQQYPQIAQSWYANWDNLMVFLQYPNAIRKVIYTTNVWNL
nr:transposase [Cardinium endosymbiont of Oedothorax gibbosus]